MSTYSSTLRIELIGAGEQDGVWGETTNSNLGTIIESAITNAVDITFTNAQYTLSANNGLPDEARNAVLNLIGTNSTAQNLIAPSVEKTYIVKNATGATVTIKTSAGGSTGVAIQNGSTQIVWSDGTNFYLASGVVAGTGITVSGAVVNNAGVVNLTGGTAINVSASTGNVTVNNTGVVSAVGTANAVVVSSATGNVTFSIASASNGFGVRTVSASTPTGGNDGDIWYQI
jgi:hypothetical protein